MDKPLFVEDSLHELERGGAAKLVLAWLMLGYISYHMISPGVAADSN